MADFVMKQHDTRPALERPLLDNGVAIDLSTASAVKFLLKPHDVALGAAVARACTIIDPAGGVVRLVWQSSDTAVVGLYDVEFEITWSDGGVETVPNDSYYTVQVVADLG